MSDQTNTEASEQTGPSIDPLDRKPHFTRKDWITLPISTLALLSSGLGLYFSNIRVEDRLAARVLGAYVMSDRDSSDTQDTLIVQVAFINAGNREAIVLEPICLLRESTRQDTLRMAISNPQAFPLALQPREVRLVNVHLAATTVGDSLGNLPEDREPDEGQHTYNCALRLKGLDSKALLTDTATTEEMVRILVRMPLDTDDKTPRNMGAQGHPVPPAKGGAGRVRMSAELVCDPNKKRSTLIYD